jgi:hypothetical protein
MDKVSIIKGSLQCFVLGWLALLPVIGVVPAGFALAAFRRVRSEAGAEWNPAGGYLIGGCLLAWVGLGLWSLVLGGALIVVAVNLNAL